MLHRLLDTTTASVTAGGTPFPPCTGVAVEVSLKGDPLDGDLCRDVGKPANLDPVLLLCLV
jgi:hypothetical protein